MPDPQPAAPRTRRSRQPAVSADDGAPDTAPREMDQMGGFAKGLAVIEAFGRSRRGLTIAEVARATGLDRATARRCLHTLANGGYAISDGRYFELTPRILRLGQSYLSAPLPALIQPSLDRLADEIRESCSASALDGAEIVYLARASHQHLMGAGLHAGSRLPAYCTSMGRVLLASLPPPRRLALLKASERRAITGRTLTDLDALMQELEKVQKAGYALIDQEVSVGSRSVAVPLRNMSGKTVAAINVAAHTSRATIAQLRQAVLPAMLACQGELARILP